MIFIYAVRDLGPPRLWGPWTQKVLHGSAEFSESHSALDFHAVSPDFNSVLLWFASWSAGTEVLEARQERGSDSARGAEGHDLKIHAERGPLTRTPLNIVFP